MRASLASIFTVDGPVSSTGATVDCVGPVPGGLFPACPGPVSSDWESAIISSDRVQVILKFELCPGGSIEVCR